LGRLFGPDWEISIYMGNQKIHGKLHYSIHEKPRNLCECLIEECTKITSEYNLILIALNYITFGLNSENTEYSEYFTDNKFIVGFEVLTAVVMKSTIFWDIMPCSPLKVNRHFGEHIAPFSGSNNKPSKKPA
jgi:hypothetical protein